MYSSTHCSNGHCRRGKVLSRALLVLTDSMATSTRSISSTAQRMEWEASGSRSCEIRRRTVYSNLCSMERSMGSFKMAFKEGRSRHMRRRILTTGSLDGGGGGGGERGVVGGWMDGRHQIKIDRLRQI